MMPTLWLRFYCRTKCKLRGSTFVVGNLADASLRRANLTHTNLEFSTLARASLSQATFIQAWLYGVNFIDADLTYADFTGSNLEYANVFGANMFHVNLSDANLSNLRNWDEAFWLAARYNANTIFPEGMNPDECNVRIRSTRLQYYSLRLQLGAGTN